MLVRKRIMITIPPRRSLHALHALGQVRVGNDLSAVLAEATDESQVDAASTVSVRPIQQVGVREVEHLDNGQVVEPTTLPDKHSI